MAYRNKTYVAFASEDILLYRLMEAWRDNDNIDFDFFKVVCCNFKLLEMKSNEWKNINNKNL